ncbi:NAD(P)H-binding protein [Limosilactobacillus sp. Sa3CUN2]|uniref:NAD(P)H-binding protein n=1 Tax=Limosilactobacillus avistercoris TaxID=2762243 RepID=A0ABR8PDM4_9LACO|nr:NAD(P)H-binding protein [Limosilactobacillus avistercoris]MBD7895391.1 NAD(P)H-binding protein [Limosilactobacillus avistercoris]
MTKQVLILGATGQIAGHAIDALLANSDDHLLLYTRHPQNLKNIDENRETVIKGDILKQAELDAAVAKADVIYANLRNPEIKQQAENIVNAMDKHGVKQLVWISSIGIYDEVPGKFGEWNNAELGGGQKDSYLGTYRSAADVVSASDIDYTIIRPAWLTNKDEVDYETTERGETFKGTEVSRKLIGNFVAKIIDDPAPYARKDFGVNKPNTDGDKPSWY